MEKGRILVVDDEPQILRVLRTALAANGYEVRTAGDGEEAIDLLESFRPDLVITDLSMPKMNGAELSSAIRHVSAVPIIVLSVRGEERWKVEALDSGADDYVTKPFHMNELLARVRAGLRRARAGHEHPAESTVVGDFSVDPEAHRITVRGKEVRLTPKEFELLRYFSAHEDKVLTHRVILNAVWGGHNVENVEYLRVFVNTLRRKVGAAYIVTEPWVGYRFRSRLDEAD